MEASTLKCIVLGCQWTYKCSFERHPKESLRLIELHMEHTHRQQAPVACARDLVEHVPPSIDIGVDQEKWIDFQSQWHQYCKGSEIPQHIQSLQLLNCASSTLGTMLLKDNPHITSCSVETVLERLRTLAVTPMAENSKADLAQIPPAESSKIQCPVCKGSFRKFNGRNFRAFLCCLNCFRRSNKRFSRRHPKLMAISKSDSQLGMALQHQSANYGLTAQLSSTEHDNHTDQRRYHRRAHPRVTIRLRPVGSGKCAAAGKCVESGKCVKTGRCAALGKYITVSGVADTGAQTNIWGIAEFLSSGLDESILHKTPLSVYAANREPLNIVGGFLAELEGDTPEHDQVSCQTMIYISRSVTGLFVSFDTLIRLRVVSDQFPVIGDHSRTGVSSISSDVILGSVTARSILSGCSNQQKGTLNCDCPQRSAVPLRPRCLPYKPVPENNLKMKEWLLQHFKSSTFNTCPHRPLQEMAGPPISIHISQSAEPRVNNTPSTVALHWQEQVKADIKRDEALGILERVPYDVPVTWCHRMVVTRKHNGSPRRTVDLSPLNKFCKRETHGSESPYHLARRVPPNNWKTVTDAWNGYHSVPLRESDRHLTTFITPFGRWRYTRAPQGFLSSGDGYNRRFAAVLEDFPRKERCVDDTIHYDQDLEKHWWRTIDFLIKVGQSGIVLNPEKFQFAQKAVNFAGFRITDETVEPLPKYLRAIELFPKPKTTTDIKSWFGLVNQVSSYAQLRDLMSPFREFLSPKKKFTWNSELDNAFEKSKDTIVNLIKKGVQIFDTKKPTCLRPDWSQKGIGYFLLQKHCKCSNELPGCCGEGWKTTLAGSRFLSGTESRYAAIEGEALAIAWGLEQTKYFTQGCDDLLVVTDHKPLVKVFGDRTLDEITNTRLFRLKQRTLQWKFRTAYLPGKTNAAADATSRYPSPTLELSLLTIDDVAEQLMAAAISNEAADVTTLSWDTIVRETEQDPVLVQLKQAIIGSFQGEYPLVSEYRRYSESLFIQDGAIMYQDRVIIPTVLRQIVLDSLHAAHQGASSMQARAQGIVFWPGMTRDINLKRDQCIECHRNAPSQAALPSEPPEPPTVPFQKIYADFFDFGGRHYLVAGDRLSGFAEVFFTPTGTAQSGARGLIACLRKWFKTFGVPEQLSSDGGPEFVADTTKNFLQKWGVQHRKSSAYHAKSNGRAEVAVKTVKRLMRTNVGPTGNLDTDRFLRAMLQLRNTPDPDCGVSPAEIVFGRPLRDNLLFAAYIKRSSYSRRWQEAWSAKENALRARFIRTSEILNEHARDLPPLVPGDSCFLQNQTGNFKKKWHHTGVVMEALPHDQYVVKVDGSGRLTTRNRQFLRRYTPSYTNIKVGTRGNYPFQPPLVLGEGKSPPVMDMKDQSIQRDGTAGVSLDMDMSSQPREETLQEPSGQDPHILLSSPHEIPCLTPYKSHPQQSSPLLPVSQRSSPRGPQPRQSSSPCGPGTRQSSPRGPQTRQSSLPLVTHRTLTPTLERAPLAMRQLRDFNKRGLKE